MARHISQADFPKAQNEVQESWIYIGAMGILAIYFLLFRLVVEILYRSFSRITIPLVYNVTPLSFELLESELWCNFLLYASCKVAEVVPNKQCIR